MRVSIVWYIIFGLLVMWGISDLTLNSNSSLYVDGALEYLPYFLITSGLGGILFLKITSRRYETIGNYQVTIFGFWFYTILFGLSVWVLWIPIRNGTLSNFEFTFIGLALLFLAIRRLYKFRKFRLEKKHARRENFDDEERRRRENFDDEERRRRENFDEKINPPSSNNELNKYYELLELDQSATPTQIKEKYRQLIKFYHPDNFQTYPEKLEFAEKKTKEITEAYENLKNIDLT
jgi:hypothetical protein